MREGRPLAERIGPRADSADAATNCGFPRKLKAHLMLVIRSWRECSSLPYPGASEASENAARQISHAPALVTLGQHLGG